MAEGAALAAVLLVLLAWPLCTPPIGHHGEAREGLVVQDIVANGHWILPRRNGDLPSKPPLFHWAAALSTEVFGASDASLRLPSAIAAVVVALTTYALGVW
ncbi:MAG: glycosyltransferase family 39 protein, partial [Candidatus Binatia bacterium]